MVDVRILELRTNRVAVPRWSEQDVEADDEVLLLKILAREIRQRRLVYGRDGYRIQAWDRRKGWVEHSR